MGFYDKFPYSNFQELNLDWIIQKIKSVEDSMNAAAGSAEAAAGSAVESAASAEASAGYAAESAASAEASAGSAGDAAASAQGIEDAREQIYLNTQRLNNLIVDGQQTEGNTELLDIRVGYDGTIYDTAGNAVRGQVSDLNDDLETDIGEIREATINVFTGKDMISGLSNMQYSDYVASNTQADTTTSKSLYVRLRDNDNEDSSVLGIAVMVNGQTYSATFTKASDSRLLWFHAGGASKNLRVFINVSNLPNGTYTVSFKIISNDVNTIDGFKIGNIQIESGSTAHAYTYPYTAKDDVARNDLDALEADVYAMVKPSKNLNGNWELGGIEYTTGTPYQSTTNVRSKLIPVEKGKTYAFDISERSRAYSCYAFFYDETGAYISGSRITTQFGFFPKIITVPDNDSIKYIRLNMQTADVDISNGQAEENIMSTTYRDPAQPTFNKMEMSNSIINYMGKKIVVFGDSITAMGDDSSTASKGWTSWFKASVKPSAYHTYAVGGSSVCDYASGDFLSEQIDAFINDSINDIDCFIISSGTNDLNHTIPTDAEIEAQFYDANMDTLPLSDVDKTTWPGALRYAVETLRNNSKKAKIFICTPVNRTYDSNEPVRSLYGTIKDKCEIIKKMCYRLGVECIDTHECGVYGNTYYLTDKLHTSEVGARMISEYIISRYMQWFNIE